MEKTLTLQRVSGKVVTVPGSYTGTDICQGASCQPSSSPAPKGAWTQPAALLAHTGASPADSLAQGSSVQVLGTRAFRHTHRVHTWPPGPELCPDLAHIPLLLPTLAHAALPTFLLPPPGFKKPPDSSPFPLYPRCPPRGSHPVARPPMEAPAALQCGAALTWAGSMPTGRNPFTKMGATVHTDAWGEQKGSDSGQRNQERNSAERDPVSVALPGPGSPRPLLSPLLSSKLWPGAWQYEQSPGHSPFPAPT